LALLLLDRELAYSWRDEDAKDKAAKFVVSWQAQSYNFHKKYKSSAQAHIVLALRRKQGGTAFASDARSFPLHVELYFDSTNIFGTSCFSR
jgi:hypothetical protein